MSFLDIVLLAVCFLYAIILYRILVNIEHNDKKSDAIYKDVCGYIEDLRQRHNSLIEKQKEAYTCLLKDVDTQLENANHKHVKNYESFLGELNQVKQFISQGFLRR